MSPQTRSSTAGTECEPVATDVLPSGRSGAKIPAWLAFDQTRRSESDSQNFWVRLGLDPGDLASYFTKGRHTDVLFSNESRGFGPTSLESGKSIGAWATERFDGQDVLYLIGNGAGNFVAHTMKSGISGATFYPSKRIDEEGWAEMEGDVEVCLSSRLWSTFDFRSEEKRALMRSQFHSEASKTGDQVAGLSVNEGRDFSNPDKPTIVVCEPEEDRSVSPGVIR